MTDNGAETSRYFEFATEPPEFYTTMERRVAEGCAKYEEDIVEGLEKVPQSFIGLLEGRNVGKLIIRVS